MILRAGLVTQEMIASVAGSCGVYVPKPGEQPKSPGMAYKHYAPKCRTALFAPEELDQAQALYREEEKRGGVPCFFCEDVIARSLKGCRVLDLGSTGEEMANRLYDLLHRGEEEATLLIGICPKERGGVFEGVLNRLTRAFGG